MGHRVCGADEEERRRRDGTGRDIPQSVPQRRRCDPSYGLGSHGYKVEAQLARLTLQISDRAIPVLGFVGVGARIDSSPLDI